jgi:phosphoglycerate dehydrogenase-like enzyme
MTRNQFRVAIMGDYEDVATRFADWSKLGSDVEVVAFNRRFETQDELTAVLADFDVITLMRERTPLPREVIAHLSRPKLIVFTGKRNSALDYGAAKERQIIVCNTPSQMSHLGSQSSSPAELTIALMLACAWRIPQADARVRRGEWASPAVAALRGRALGIVGYGRIGKVVALCGRALGMKILAFSRSLVSEVAASDGVVQCDLDPLLHNADVVSLHLPLTPETSGVIGRQQFDAMKPGVIFVNTARAGLVEGTALIDSLRNGHIAMAGLDVFDAEPLPFGHPLLTLPNVLMTPHIGYATIDNLKEMWSRVVETVAAYRKGIVINRAV